MSLVAIRNDNLLCLPQSWKWKRTSNDPSLKETIVLEMPNIHIIYCIFLWADTCFQKKHEEKQATFLQG